MINPIRSLGKLILLSILSTTPLAAQTVYTVETVPNVKLVNNSYVSNPDNILSASTVESINSKLGTLERETSTQVAVVALNSIGNADIFPFAQELFVKWGIGQAKKDNGLLILLVVDQRTVRFHTGYGLEGVLPDAVCKEIQMKSMIPSFREGNYDLGILDGVGEVVNILSNESYRAELMDNSRREADGWTGFFPFACSIGGGIILFWFLGLHWSGSFDNPDKKIAEEKKKDKKGKDKTEKKRQYPEMRLTRPEWLLLFAAGPIALLFAFNFIAFDTDDHILVFLALLYGYLGLTLIHKRLRMKKVADKFVKEGNFFNAAIFFNDYQVFWLVMTIFFPLPGIFLYWQYNARKNYFRNHPRNCKSCGQLIKNKLDEKADDQYLQKSQVFEEGLKSIDYDVWHCTSCQSVEVLNFPNRFSKYDPCPYCAAKAFYLESDRTITSPTYTSTGTGQKTHKCKFCGKSSVSTYTIPVRTRSEDRDSSSSSSSSGGGSWGGGSSGGGGSSSSW